MAEDSEPTMQLSGWIERWQAGDEGARDRLIEHAYQRLRRLTRKMLKGYPRLRRWDETDDVLHNALGRFLRALREVKPATAAQFFGLAATQIRRELIDLTRHYCGPQGPGAHEDRLPAARIRAGRPTRSRIPRTSPAAWRSGASSTSRSRACRSRRGRSLICSSTTT
jgi:hypothetical protein